MSILARARWVRVSRKSRFLHCTRPALTFLPSLPSPMTMASLSAKKASAPSLSWRQLPPLTSFIMVLLCFVFFVLQCFYGIKHKPYNLRPKRILQYGEYYRLFTSSVMHRNCQHLGMNLLGSFFTGSELERDYGRFYLFMTTVLSMVATPVLYVVLAHVHDSYAETPFKPCKGFSSIFFHWMTLDCLHNRGSTYNLLEMIPIPALWYPWALTAMLAALYPRSCWLMHICGILTGALQYYIERIVWFPSDTLKETGERDGVGGSSSFTCEAMDPASVREARLRKFEANYKAEKYQPLPSPRSWAMVVGVAFAALIGSVATYVSRSATVNWRRDVEL